MNLTRLALRNAQFIIILLLIILVIGVRSFTSMPRSEDPQVNFPFYVISVIFPGTSPEDMESLIVDPLEEALNELSDIKVIQSFIGDGVVVISVEAEFSVVADEKYNEVVRQVNLVRPSLPDGIVFFKAEQIKPADRVSYKLFALSSPNVSYQHLFDFAEKFEDRLEQIEGINDISIDAMPEEEIRISLDYERMAAQNISLQQVIGILQQNNVNLPGGEISAGSKNFSIQSTGSFDDLPSIQNTIIAAGNNRVVYLKDIAKVEKTYEDIRWKAEFQKEACIYIGVKLKEGYNILDVDQSVTEITAEFESQLPPNIHLGIAFEQVTGVKSKINDFFMNLLQGILLVAIVIFLFIGWRASLIIITLIPICIILALAVLNGAGFGIQQISIASLVLALGLLVDNGIVVIENITRFIKEGFSREDAALKGASEVGLAVVSSTATTLLSFFPLTQLGGGPGLFLQSLPLTVIFTLVISLILALTFSPIMSKWVLSKKSGKLTLADKFFKWFTDTFYRPTLQFILSKWSIKVLGKIFTISKGIIPVIGALLITIFSLSLFSKIGVSFFPTADKPLLIIDIDTPPGSSLEETEKAVRFVESIIDTMDVVKDYSLNIGNSNPQIYYNRIPKQFDKQHGQIVLNLKEWNARSFYTSITNLRRAFSTYIGAEITVEELKNGAPIEAPIELRLIGDDLGELKEIAFQVEDILRNTDGVINISNPLSRNQTILKVNLDREKAGLLGVSSLLFDQTIRASLNGLKIDEVTLQDQQDYGLVVRMPFDENPSIEDFDKIYLTNRQGRNVPLNHISNIQFEGSTPEFSHYNLRRYVAITGSLVNLDNTYSTTLEIMDKLEQLELPLGNEIIIGGEYEEQQSTFGNLGIIGILALIAIFAVLVLQFRSAVQPIIVFAAIPLALCGSFLCLYLTGWSFSFFAFIGIISLIGIVVNNSIIMVDYINQLRTKGESLIDAIILGSIRRFKPIILTTVTTILGLIPLTLQKTNQWSPLCLTIIGGMISSTVLSLIVVPVLYQWLSKKSRYKTADEKIEE